LGELVISLEGPGIPGLRLNFETGLLKTNLKGLNQGKKFVPRQGSYFGRRTL